MVILKYVNTIVFYTLYRSCYLVNHKFLCVESNEIFIKESKVNLFIHM